MSIDPDTKDWTWVLDRPCADCGLDTTVLAGRDVPALLRTSLATWEHELGRDDVRVRPDPATWSTLEYGAHVRDVCRLFDDRLDLMLTRDDPEFDDWDQDATAVAASYSDQDPPRVAGELIEAAEQLAAHFDAVSGAGWQRTGRRTDGARFTVDSFARYFLHDVLHHLHDIGAGRPQDRPRVG